MIRTDVIVIGAGPAGLAAAGVLVDHGLEIAIIEEQGRAGGQFLRQPPEEFRVRGWLKSRQYAGAKRLYGAVTAKGNISWYTRSTALGILKNADPAFPHRVSISNQDGIQEIAAAAVLVAAGCHDMPVIFPGWNLPGVMAAGGIQAFIKSQQVVPGNRFLLVGTHPLQLIVADQIRQAGGEVAGVVFPQRLSKALAVLKYPGLLFGHLDKFLYIGMTFLRLWLAGVKIRFAATVTAASGDEHLDSAAIAKIDRRGDIDGGGAETIRCDRLGLCFGFLVSSELPRQAGAQCAWSAEGGGWIICHDEWMRTTIPGLYVAGETTGIAGADAAMQEGRLAGLGIALDRGRLSPQAAVKLSTGTRTELRRHTRFADLLKLLAAPENRLLEQMMTSDSTLCKCEEVSVGAFRRILEENGYISKANAAKLLSRVGMGLCQGRYCQYHLTRMLAKHSGLPEEDTGPFTARFPVRPVRISSLFPR